MPKHNERALRQKNAHADACATDQHYFVREGDEWVCKIGTCTVRRPFGVAPPIELSALQDEASELLSDLAAIEA